MRAVADSICRSARRRVGAGKPLPNPSRGLAVRPAARTKASRPEPKLSRARNRRQEGLIVGSAHERAARRAGWLLQEPGVAVCRRHGAGGGRGPRRRDRVAGDRRSMRSRLEGRRPRGGGSRVNCRRTPVPRHPACSQRRRRRRAADRAAGLAVPRVRRPGRRRGPVRPADSRRARAPHRVQAASQRPGGRRPGTPDADPGPDSQLRTAARAAPAAPPDLPLHRRLPALRLERGTSTPGLPRSTATGPGCCATTATRTWHRTSTSPPSTTPAAPTPTIPALNRSCRSAV